MLSFRRTNIASSETREDSTPSVSSAEDEAPPAHTSTAATTPVVDVDMMSQTLALCDHIIGLYGLEMFNFEYSSGKLVSVGLGPDTKSDEGDVESQNSAPRLFIKRRTQESDDENDYYTKDAAESYDRLTNQTRDDYLAASPIEPGLSVAGLLWSEMSSSHGIGQGHGGQDSVVWRDVQEIADDPDQPYDERLQHLAKAGFTLAAGIPFDCNGYKGIVVIYGNPHGSRSKLNDPINVRFMVHVANLLGSVAAIRTPLDQQKEFRRLEAYNNWHRLKIKLLAVVWFGGATKKMPEGKKQTGLGKDDEKMDRRSSLQRLQDASARLRTDFKQTVSEVKDSVRSKATRWAKKCQGGNAGIPPSFTWTATMWSFAGILITHLVLSGINVMIGKLSDGDLSLILAPLGALTTLQYNLTAAPASQPRNAILGQIFAITVANCIAYIKQLPKWLKPVIAPAIVIPGMARLGITHPPAGAAAVVFAAGKPMRWDLMGVFLIGVCVAIFNAVVINNLSDKRQYPTSWPLLKKAKKIVLK